MDTVAHEVTYALLVPQHGHSPQWRATAIKLGGSGNGAAARSSIRLPHGLALALTENASTGTAPRRASFGAAARPGSSAFHSDSLGPACDVVRPRAEWHRQFRGRDMDQPSLLMYVAESFRNVGDNSLRRTLLSEIDGEWPALRVRDPIPEDAETCRLAMLFAAQLHDFPQADLWRVRAMARYVRVGWVEGVASLMLSAAFKELARANNDYPEGRYLDAIRPSAVALAMVDELEPFAVEPGSGISTGYGSPTPSLVARFVHENRGFLLLVEGRLDDARVSYMHAVDADDSSRSRVKSRLGLALVDYVSGLRTGDPVSSDATQILCAEAESMGLWDLVASARSNAEEMDRRGRHLVPYAIL